MSKFSFNFAASEFINNSKAISKDFGSRIDLLEETIGLFFTDYPAEKIEAISVVWLGFFSKATLLHGYHFPDSCIIEVYGVIEHLFKSHMPRLVTAYNMERFGKRTKIRVVDYGKANISFIADELFGMRLLKKSHAKFCNDLKNVRHEVTHRSWNRLLGTYGKYGRKALSLMEMDEALWAGVDCTSSESNVLESDLLIAHAIGVVWMFFMALMVVDDCK